MSEDMMTDHTSQGAMDYAAANNLDVVLPDNNQLFIDVDDLGGTNTFNRNFDLVDAVYGVKDVKKTSSRSNVTDLITCFTKKPFAYHIVVTLRTPVSAMERILLQAILGSDRRREAHSMVRLSKSDPNPTLFFEKKTEVKDAGSTVSDSSGDSDTLRI